MSEINKETRKEKRKKQIKNFKKALTVMFFAGVTALVAVIILYVFAFPQGSISQIEAQTDAITVEITENPKADFFEIQYSTSPQFNTEDTKRKKVTGNVTNIDELEPNTLYYIRMRSRKIMVGKRFPSVWSSSQSVVTKSNTMLVYLNTLPIHETILTGKTVELKTIVFSSEKNRDNIKFKSSDEKIASVDDNGIITGVAEGVATITVYDEKSGKSVDTTVKVRKPYVAATGIEITDKKGQSVETGEQIQLHANVIPADATNQEIVWSVKDSTKATIDENGLITALRPTEYLEITAKTKDEKFSAVYKMKVTKTKGFLTKEDLDKLDLASVDNVMFVAHPDDETLWGGSHLMNDRYLVIVMTNSYKEQRKEELMAVMKRSNDKYLILSYPDIKNTWYDENNKYKYSVDKWSTVSKAADEDIQLVLNYKKWKTIATHNPNGEYGHLQHRMVSEKVTKALENTISNDQEFYYFGNWYKKDETNPDPQLDKDNLDKKNKLVDVYIPSSPYAIANNRHMVPYENWIPYAEWNDKKSR